MEIKRTLVLSTAHLPQLDFELLERGSEVLPYRFIDHEYGCILVLHVETIVEESSDWDWKNTLPKLKPIVDLAIANECINIEFDQDGEEIEGLEIWNW